MDSLARNLGRSARPVLHHGHTREPRGSTPGCSCAYSGSIRTLRSGPNTSPNLACCWGLGGLLGPPVPVVRRPGRAAALRGGAAGLGGALLAGHGARARHWQPEAARRARKTAERRAAGLGRRLRIARATVTATLGARESTRLVSTALGRLDSPFELCYGTFFVYFHFRADFFLGIGNKLSRVQ